MLRHFAFTTAGESHGKGVLVIIEGLPAGVPLSPSDIAEQLARRQAGHGRGERMQIERDAGELGVAGRAPIVADGDRVDVGASMAGSCQKARPTRSIITVECQR